MNRLKISAGLAVLGGALVLAPSAGAKVFTPSGFGDHAPHGCKSGNCTLREAVIAANARPGIDTVELRSGKAYKLKLPNPSGVQENLSATGDLDILGPLKVRSIDKTKQAAIQQTVLDRVFQLGTPTTFPGSALFKRLKIRGGSAGAASSGGGILVEQGAAKVLQSTLSSNSAGLHGGGVAAVAPGATASINSSTLSGNSANFGGGFSATSSAFITAVNSTLSQNSAGSFGGGAHASVNGVVNVTSVTVARNTTAGNGGGISIASGGGGFFVRNTILALNSALAGGNDCHAGAPAVFSGSATNLVGDLSGACASLAPSSIPTTSPRIKGLSNNGGLTKTIALRKSSPAVDKASKNKAVKVDQRGETRGKKPDIGAYERIN
jgi:hypothetical protein